MKKCCFSSEGALLQQQNNVHPVGTVWKEHVRCQNGIGVILQSEVELRVWLGLRPRVLGALPSGFPWLRGLQSI